MYNVAKNSVEDDFWENPDSVFKSFHVNDIKNKVMSVENFLCEDNIFHYIYYITFLTFFDSSKEKNMLEPVKSMKSYILYG